MCPLCIATGTLIAASASSAGGLTALAVKVLRVRSKAELNKPVSGQPNRGIEHGVA